MSTSKTFTESVSDPGVGDDRMIRTDSSGQVIDALRHFARQQPQAVVSVISDWLEEELPETD